MKASVATPNIIIKLPQNPDVSESVRFQSIRMQLVSQINSTRKG